MRLLPCHQHSITSHMSPSDTLFIVFQTARFKTFNIHLETASTRQGSLISLKPTENIILVLWRKLWTKLNTIMMTQSDWLIKWRMTLQQHKISGYSLNLSLKLLGLRLQHHYFFIDSKNAQKLKLKNMHRDFYNSMAGRPSGLRQSFLWNSHKWPCLLAG